MTFLLEHLEARRRGGRKLLVPYVMAGQPERDSFGESLTAVDEFADAIEIGLPYSDPLMDGPVIAAAGERSLRAGVSPLVALELASKTAVRAPRLAMTYYNPVHSLGEDDFCRRAAHAGIAGLIVPDLPVEESSGLRAAARAHGLAWIPLVAPTSPPPRIEAIAATATGFVYAVSTLGVTGTRERLSERATRLARACKEATDLPVLVGVGISTPEQARAAASEADGVVIGSAVVALIEESGPVAAATFLDAVRDALDGAVASTA